MKQFFKSFLGSLLGVFVAGIIVIILFFVMLIGTMAGGASMFGKQDKESKVKDNSVLHIKLNKPIVERTSDNPFDNFDFGSFSSNKPLGMHDILKSIEKAKTDDRIKGIYLDLSSISAGFATIQEIRNALLDFKESEKWIVSYSEVYSQGAYYIASVADEIYLYPEGGLDFRGLRSEIVFFKGMLEKLEIEAQIIRGRNNKFKSAVEPFMLDKMSDANRAQTEKYVGALWAQVLKGISEERGISVEKLTEIADSMYIRNPKDALEYKMVDKLIYKDEMLALLREKLEIEEKDEINTAALSKYFKAKDPNDKGKKEDETKDRIAVVYAAGNIISGENSEGNMGSETTSKALREARLDSTVKAIVFRINSGGGSALASDVMWREAVLASEAKPLIVSMGDVAASGGYYIACAADKIYASPTTITGSIGVFGILPNCKDFFKNKLGITFDVVKTNTYSDLGTISRALTPAEYNIIQESVEEIYDSFMQKVADGRGMTLDEVDQIGQGRVWSGTDALEIGLIDELGGLKDAIAEAAEMAGLEDYELMEFPKRKGPFEEFFKELIGEAEARMLKAQLGSNYKYYQYAKSLSEMDAIQARLPYLIEIY